MSSEDYSTAWSDWAPASLGGGQMDLDFDSQAFFNDYIFTEMANQQAFGLGPPSGFIP